MEEEVQINSRDYWFKIVEFLQQNWALIDSKETGGCTVLFGLVKPRPLGGVRVSWLCLKNVFEIAVAKP